MHQVLAHCRKAGLRPVTLDGMLSFCDRATGTTEDGNDLRCPGQGPPLCGQCFCSLPLRTASH